MAGHGRTWQDIGKIRKVPGVPGAPDDYSVFGPEILPTAGSFSLEQEPTGTNRNQQELTRTKDIEVYDKSYSSLRFFTDSHPHGRRKRATDATVAKR